MYVYTTVEFNFFSIFPVPIVFVQCYVDTMQILSLIKTEQKPPLKRMTAQERLIIRTIQSYYFTLSQHIPLYV